jgi:hypothetical protein
VLKNVIANRLFLDLHDAERAYLTQEFRSGLSRADVVILNGTSTVYEVKTELDSFSKLQSQLADYRLIFDRICVVVPESIAETTMRIVSRETGVVVVQNDLQVSTIQEPKSNKINVSPAQIFDCMRRAEYEAAVRAAFGHVPDVPNALRYSACKAMFVQLSPSVAHDLMVSSVQLRGANPARAMLLSEMPESLAHACLTVSESKAFIDRLRHVLRSAVGPL